MKNLTAGEKLRLIMKRNNLKQVDLANKLNLNRQNVSQAIKNFDENKGNINTLIEYADAIGYKINFEFIKKED